MKEFILNTNYRNRIFTNIYGFFSLMILVYMTWDCDLSDWVEEVVYDFMNGDILSVIAVGFMLYTSINGIYRAYKLDKRLIFNAICVEYNIGR